MWFSQEGYQHNLVGQRVSQIQAVLARRCATIGDLQQHLLRAGWQRGVGQWGEKETVKCAFFKIIFLAF